jgi:hypothetical protein
MMQPITLRKESSLILQVEYDEDTKKLRVHFQKGKVAEYSDVSQVTVDALRLADSPGQYFLQNIRGHYEWGYV